MGDSPYVLVRREPSEAMIEAGWIDTEGVTPRDIWLKMLSASPAIPIDVLKEVKEALEPLAKAADKTNERCIDSVRLSRDRPCDELTVGDLRRAKSALARLDELMEKMG